MHYRTSKNLHFCLPLQKELKSCFWCTYTCLCVQHYKRKLVVQHIHLHFKVLVENALHISIHIFFVARNKKYMEKVAKVASVLKLTGRNPLSVISGLPISFSFRAKNTTVISWQNWFVLSEKRNDGHICVYIKMENVRIAQIRCSEFIICAMNLENVTEFLFKDVKMNVVMKLYLIRVTFNFLRNFHR